MKNVIFFLMLVALMNVVVGIVPAPAAPALPPPAAQAFAGFWQLADARGTPICVITLVAAPPATTAQPQPINRMSAKKCPGNIVSFDMWWPTTNSIVLTSYKPPRDVMDFQASANGTYVASDPKAGPGPLYEMARVSP